MSLMILNTRPIEGGGHLRLNQLIEALGDKSLSLPLIKTENINFKLPDLRQFHYLIFVSQAAVHGFMQKAKGLIPPACQCVCIGKASANALSQYGIKTEAYAPEANSEALMNNLIFSEVNNKQVLWIKGNRGRRVIGEELTAKGAHVQELIVYQSTPIDYPEASLAAIAKNTIDMVILTSEQAIIHYHHLFKHHQTMFDTPCFLVFSPRLARLAKKYFRGHILISRHDLILQTISAYKANL